MRLAEWKTNQNLVAWMNSLVKQPEWSELLNTMGEEHPMHTMLGFGASEADNLKHVGHIEGYQMAMNNLRTAADIASEKDEPLRATFEKPAAEDQE